MPAYCYLDIEPDCPYCGLGLSVIYQYTSFKIQFQWGYCPYLSAGPENTYHVGDSIHWYRCPDGTIVPNAYFHGLSSANTGDPAIRHLIVTDTGSTARLKDSPCPHCGLLLGGCAVEIKDNVIQRGWVYRSEERGGEFAGDYSWYGVSQDGTYSPLVELENAAVAPLDSQCREVFDNWTQAQRQSLPSDRSETTG